MLKPPVAERPPELPIYSVANCPREAQKHALLQKESLWATGCCLIAAIIVWLAKPFVAAGFNDDWSYANIALVLAETGRFHYNGWVWSMALFQAFWGAAWIRFFGFSFDLLRFATLPFSLGFVWLSFLLGRKAGLRRDLACFAALVIGTSPLYIPLEASFMTDPYGCFFIALCLYAAIRCIECRSSRSAIAWLWVLTLSGAFGGSDRQTVWAAPASLIPYLIWTRRADRRFFVNAWSAYILSIALIALALRLMPKYSPIELPTTQGAPFLVHSFLLASGRLVDLCLACLQTALPALLCFAPLWKNLGYRRCALSLAGATFGALALLWLTDPQGAVPYVASVLSQFGILPEGIDALGYRPILLPPLLRVGLGLLILFSLFAFLQLSKRSDGMPKEPKVVFGVFAIAYAALLVPGAMAGLVHDRYVLPLAPLVAVSVLHSFQSFGRTRYLAGWLSLAVLAGYGVVITHDYYSALRARVTAADELQARGIQRTRISAGYEYDGWTELQALGSVKQVHKLEWNYTNEFWFWNYARGLRPEYVASDSDFPELPRQNMVEIPFSAWMPPFRRVVVARRREDLPKSRMCDVTHPCAARNN